MPDSDDDWFNTDENKLEQNLKQQIELKVASESAEERIEYCGKFKDDREPIIADVSAPGRFTTGELAKSLEMPPLEMFLYFMAGRRDLLNDQLMASDSPKRISMYVQVLTVLGHLEFGGFNEQLFSAFANQPVLMDHLKRFEMFTPSIKSTIDVDAEQTLQNIFWLIIRAHKLGVLKETGYQTIDHCKMLLDNSSLREVLKKPACVELANAIKSLSTVEKHVKNEIYPTLDDLQRYTNRVITPAVPGNVSSYINWQRLQLCEDFLRPLREFVQHLRIPSMRVDLVKQNLVLEHTQLLRNPKFAEAIILMDTMPKKRNGKDISQNVITKIKTGSLLCFTSSYDYDNLILATVTYTQPDRIKQGYLNVEIVKQYNIGNIYNRPLIMFETPEFFEPYLRVHNYLSTCSADDFPMRNYIIKQDTKPFDVRPPSYISPDTQLTYNGKPFIAAKPPKDMQLNDIQRSALSAALTNEFCLIQGPPGTGKTHLSAELLNTLLQNAEHLKLGPIIVLAYTNDALDKFVLKVSKHTDNILRFGSQTRLPEVEKYNVRNKVDEIKVPSSVKRLWLLLQGKYKAQFKRLQALHKDFDGSEESYVEIQAAQDELQLVAEKQNTVRNIYHYHVARDKSVLAMTTTCAARLNFLFRLLQSKCIIFEEAAETAESHVLACLTPYTKHVILVGDHKQLQPHTSNHARQQQGVQISLFERLINDKFPVNVLNTQYRMRNCIAELLVPIFYDELISDSSVCEYGNVPNISTNMYFVNHGSHELQLKTDMSFVNDYEAHVLVSLLRHLQPNPSDVVILSPYNAQVEYIKQILPDNNFVVTTVDSYQGLEANIVLLSLVRSNLTGQIGFLRQPNRVCVALSRARWALYMIGNMDTLQLGKPELWGAIKRKLLAANAIGREFPLIDAKEKRKRNVKKH